MEWWVHLRLVVIDQAKATVFVEQNLQPTPSPECNIVDQEVDRGEKIVGYPSIKRRGLDVRDC